MFQELVGIRKFAPIQNWTPNIMEGHGTISQGSIVISLFMNHTLHKESVNVESRLTSKRLKDIHEHAVLFFSTNRIRVSHF